MFKKSNISENNAKTTKKAIVLKLNMTSKYFRVIEIITFLFKNEIKINQ